MVSIASIIKLKKNLPSQSNNKPRPNIASVEGVIMLIVASLVEILNMILAFLDIAFGLGTILAVILNIVSTIIIGGWMWQRTGKLPIKKALLPMGLNAIPIIRSIPFWIFAVWTSLEKGYPSKEE